MPRDDPFAAGPSAGERFAQMRTVARHSLAWPVDIFEPIDRTRFALETIQVSINGCCVRTANPLSLDQGTIVRLRIQRGQETLEVWARVTGATTNRTGLAFLGNQHREVLGRWIRAESTT